MVDSGDLLGFFKDIGTQLVSTGVAVAIVGYLLKSWLAHQLDKLRKKSSHELEVKLEEVRADWARDVARLGVHESYLHQKRVDLLVDMYEEMLEAEFSLQNFLVSWWTISNRDELMERKLLQREHIETSSVDSMKKRGAQFLEKFTNINAMLHKNAVFFEQSFIEQITGAYRPFFDTLMEFDFEDIPQLPEEMKDVVTVGKTPRLEVVDSFRAMLGVES